VQYSFNFENKSFSVDLQEDFYGQNFWERISRSEYEPDTLDFLRRHCSNESTFMDIGAANGAMTLLSASFGAHVFSYEPDPMMFRVLGRNVKLNPDLNTRILLSETALAAKNGEIDFSRGSNSRVLSDIVFSEAHKYSNKKIQVNALSEEIEKIHINNTKLVIKMDIEGAEWGILSDEDTLGCLQKHGAKMLLAVHPGFYRPHKKLFPGFNRLSLEVWRLRNYFEARRFFSKLGRYASVKRTNLNPVINSKMFAVMCLAGYHEYVIDFYGKSLDSK
jgi:FkbM family methyltransferase